MRMPEIYKTNIIIEWKNTRLYKGMYWIPARPMERNCILPWYQRFKAAWGVLTGKYDALYWLEDDK